MSRLLRGTASGVVCLVCAHTLSVILRKSIDVGFNGIIEFTFLPVWLRSIEPTVLIAIDSEKKYVCTTILWKP
jgi:hypothetical protein